MHGLPSIRLLGADLSQIHGFGPYTVMRLVAECGDDMTKWPTAKHFTSWLSLAPANKDLGRTPPELEDAPVVESCDHPAEDRGGQRRQNADGPRRVLSPPRGPHRQSQGRDRHRSETGDSFLSGSPLRPDVRGPRRFRPMKNVTGTA